MDIQGNKIVFATHAVVCDPLYADKEYMELMAETLEDESKDHSIRDHARVLRNNNNDGTWSIKKTV